MKKEKHLDVSYKYLWCVSFFMILMKYYMKFYLLSFLILKRPSKIFLYLIIFSLHFSTSLLVLF